MGMNSVIQVLYSFPIFTDYITKSQPPVKVVALKIKKGSVK